MLFDGSGTKSTGEGTMARFILKDGVSVRRLGKTVFKIAEKSAKRAGALTEKEKDVNAQRLKELIVPSFARKVEVVYDTPGKVHIIIPNLGGASYSGNEFANECMGSIVIRGCGS